jgi:HEAT repeat protein
VAPERAIPAVVRLAGVGDRERRRLLRVALGRAAASSRAEPAARAALGDASLRDHQVIELLRSLGERAAALTPQAGQAFARVARPDASFRFRYLLLEPAAILAAKDAGARAFLRRSLAADPSPHIRTQAARAIADVNTFRAELLRAVDDEHVRVREAAVEKLGERAAAFAGGPIARRLESDPWPLVRAASATALGRLAPDPALDDALADALEDASVHVRAPAAKALGLRRAVEHAAKLRDLLRDDEQAAEVRSAAAGALGELCDRESLDLLTAHARRLADPLLAEDGRMISPAALRALTRIHPPDLQKRLEPLLAAGAPQLARSAARAALRSPGTCGRRAGPAR